MRFPPVLAPAALVLAVVPFPGAAAPVFQGQIVGRPLATQNVSFLVHLPLRNEAELEQLVALQATPGTQAFHHWLSPSQFQARYGALPGDVAVAEKALRAAGIAIDRVSAQLITAHAPAATLERAFGAQFATFHGPSGKLHASSRVGLTLPPALRTVGADVEGIVYHGEGHPLLRIRRYTPGASLNRYGLFGDLWFDDIKQSYKYPSYLLANGTGVRVATVNEADFNDADLIAYLHHEKIGNARGDVAPLPTIIHALVPGAPGFDPTDPGPSAEADLDTQQVAGTAPGATLTGWTTNAFNFPSDFLQVYDYINVTNSQDIVNTSYGECELFFTAGYNGGQDLTGTLRALHDTFLQGNSQGITYTVSSGDGAGRPCPELAYFVNAGAGKSYSTVASVGIPASDPNVLAVGGGNLITSSDPSNPNDLDATYVAENAYADPEPSTFPFGDPYGVGNTLTHQFWGAGGGQSVVFTKPSWQKGITPGSTRSVPDIGLFVGGCFADNPAFVQPCADDVTHAVEIIGGVRFSVIGTSVAAPEAAGLLATIEDYQGSRKSPGSGRLGNVNALLYRTPARYYQKSIPGYNGVESFKGYNNWNPSYGLGSPFNASPFRASAGTPRTATNP